MINSVDSDRFIQFLEERKLVIPVEWEHHYRVACGICQWEENIEECRDWHATKRHFLNKHVETYELFVMSRM